MNNIDIEKLKREIKVKVGGTAVFCGLLFTLMGCGKTVVDTTVEQQPTQTIETTIDDPVVDVPVEPTTDVSDNEVEPVEEHDFSDATFIQTGENEYTINLDCPDNSSAQELSFLPSRDTAGNLSGPALNYGISVNLLNAVMTHGMQVDPLNAAGLNVDAYMDKPVTINADILGSYTYVLTNDPSAYGDKCHVYTLDDLKYTDVNFMPDGVYRLCAVYLADSISATNGNIELGIGRCEVGPEIFDNAMQECMNATGLTREEICANYGIDFVAPYDKTGLLNANDVIETLSYIAPDEAIVITTFNSNGDEVGSTSYTLNRVKSYGTI